MTADIIPQLRREVTIINQTLGSFGIDAGTRPGWTTVAGSSFIAYGLRTGAAQRISDIARILPELSERISAARRRPTPVRLREMPLALEVTHPKPQPLDWRGATMRIGAGRMIAGRNYSVTPAVDCVIDLAQKPHALAAGTTGSGKSTILRMMLASLAFNTAPDILRLVLVDRKNEDLIPFARLPHVEAAAWTAIEAREAIARVETELQRRVNAGIGEWPRLVLVIDELAQVDQASLDLLSSILAVGRSKRVNVIAATQHPVARLIGDKANYAARLVGQVIDGSTAAIATGRRNTGAELLPGAGAFLYVDGAQLDRLQAYYLGAEHAAGLVEVIREKWSGSTPAKLPVVEMAGTVDGPAITGVEPVTDEIDVIAAKIEPLYRAGASKSAMARQALDRPYAGSFAAKIDRAIARLETRSTTTTPGERRFKIVGQGEEEAERSSRPAAPILRIGAR